MGTAQHINFEFVAPLEVSFPLRARDVTITPLTVAEYPAAAQAVRPVLDALLPLVQQVLAADEAERERLMIEAAITAVEEHTAGVCALLAVCTRTTAEYVGSVLPDELVALAVVCLQVNADFFRRAAPMLKGHIEQLQQQAQLVVPPQAAAPS